MTDPTWETRLSRHAHDLDGDGHDTSFTAVFEPGATSTQVRLVAGRHVIYDNNDEAYVTIFGEIDMAATTGERWGAGVNNGDPDTASGTWHTLYGGSGLKFPELSAAPTSPFENLTYYDTTLHQLRTWDGTAWQGEIRSYATSIGNGILTTITVTHNLGTLDVMVQLYDNSTGLPVVPLTMTRATTNTVVFTFTVAPTTNAYRVVVFG